MHPFSLNEEILEQVAGGAVPTGIIKGNLPIPVTPYTSQYVGEEGGVYTTMAIGEEGGAVTLES